MQREILLGIDAGESDTKLWMYWKRARKWKWKVIIQSRMHHLLRKQEKSEDTQHPLFRNLLGHVNVYSFAKSALNYFLFLCQFSFGPVGKENASQDHTDQNIQDRRSFDDLTSTHEQVLDKLYSVAHKSEAVAYLWRQP